MAITINTLDFSEHIKDGFVYVDKSRMLSELAGSRDVFLVTRPRRFGKTMNLNMIHSFFSNEKGFGEIESVFSSLDVWIDKKAVEHAGKHPVVHISLASATGGTWEQMLENFELLAADWIDGNREVFNSEKLTAYNRVVLEKLQSGQASLGILQSSLFYFTDWLRKIYGQSVIVLIDEYDVPFIEAVNGGYYAKASPFLGSFFGKALKDNHNLEFSVITGILQAAGESIFSKMNNVHKCNLFSRKFSSCYGFTDPEVGRLARDAGFWDRIPEIRAWYSGYVFGGVEVYNPWSVMNCLYNREFKAYWVNTSDNFLIGDLLMKAPLRTVSEIEDVMAWKTVSKPISSSISFREIHKSENAIFSFLAATGYLKAVLPDPALSEDEQPAEVSLPNNEMVFCFSSLFRRWVESVAAGTMASEMLACMERGQADRFAELLNQYLLESSSFFDSSESFYHGFMLALMAYLHERYRIRSNRESGLGRFDIALFPKRLEAGILLELKKLGGGEDADALLDEAISQMDGKLYATEFKAQGFRYISYAIVFDRKKCFIKMNSESNGSV
ncbi:MAG: ATP-binding protein [Clostridiales bacterium]|nr:ATP-binding protein [Clostridiales bacterium]